MGSFIVIVVNSFNSKSFHKKSSVLNSFILDKSFLLIVYYTAVFNATLNSIDQVSK
jgi:uncharacterized membrane protein